MLNIINEFYSVLHCYCCSSNSLHVSNFVIHYYSAVHYILIETLLVRFVDELHNRLFVCVCTPYQKHKFIKVELSTLFVSYIES